MTALADGTALYRVRGDAGLLLYIGISDEFGRRWKQHAKLQPWWDEMRSLSVDEWFPVRSDAEAAEEAAIKAEGPKYNQQHSVRSKKVPFKPVRLPVLHGDNWLSISQATAVAGCSRQTLYVAIADGYLRRHVGRFPIRRDELERWASGIRRRKPFNLPPRQEEMLLAISRRRGEVLRVPHYIATTGALEKRGLIKSGYDYIGWALTDDGRRAASYLEEVASQCPLEGAA